MGTEYAPTKHNDNKDKSTSKVGVAIHTLPVLETDRHYWGKCEKPVPACLHPASSTNYSVRLDAVL